MRATLRAAIATSEEARACTDRLAGKSIAFESLGERWVVRFESGVAHVESGDMEADATMRGSPVAVLGALLGSERHAAPVLGDAAAFEDFRTSFRPHFSLPLPLPHAPRHLAEDIGDAAHLAARAAQSALEGLLAVLRERDQSAPAADESAASAAESGAAAEADELRTRVRELEARIAALEGNAGDSAANAAEDSSPAAP